MPHRNLEVAFNADDLSAEEVVASLATFTFLASIDPAAPVGATPVASPAAGTPLVPATPVIGSFSGGAPVGATPRWWRLTMVPPVEVAGRWAVGRRCLARVLSTVHT